MLTVKPVYELSDVPDDLKWATNTCDIIYTHFQDITNNIYIFTRPPIFLPVHIRFTRPNDGWTASTSSCAHLLLYSTHLGWFVDTEETGDGPAVGEVRRRSEPLRQGRAPQSRPTLQQVAHLLSLALPPLVSTPLATLVAT